MHKSKPIITMRETDSAYCAKTEGVSVTIAKNLCLRRGDTIEHPRLMAIETVAEIANLTEWNLMNI